MITLERIFSREKTLFYFTMWNDSDRLGYEKFLGYKVKNNTFIVPPPGRKGSVWYDMEELAEIDRLLKQKIISDPTLLPQLQETLNKHWFVLLPYLTKDREIQNGIELRDYYSHLVEWWSAMNIAFTIPDVVGVVQEIKDYFLERRAESEKYTEEMNKVFARTWKNLMPEDTDLYHFISPSEAIEVLTEHGSKVEVISKIKERVNGCGMFNEIIYPTLEKLNKALANSGVVLKEDIVEEVSEIKGTIAFKGKVQGKIRIIHGFNDMSLFIPGEVLVTEMTNPDYLPIMKQSAAVVTDEGGMTCHAAIASRELRIPCIVGTRIATKSLKNGDVVEVDANTGVVRKI